MDIWHEILVPANLIYTTLFIIMIMYWLMVILGALDIELFDFDIDIDADVDVDIDTDIDADVGVSGNALTSVLSFLNFGKVPFMVIYSFTSLTMWVTALFANRYLGDNSWLFGIMMLIPVLLIGLIVSKFITQPLIPVFDEMGKGEEPTDYIGKEGILKVSATKERFGKAEMHINNNIHFLSVKIDESAADDFIDKGDEIIVTSISDNEKHYYIIRRQ